MTPSSRAQRLQPAVTSVLWLLFWIGPACFLPAAETPNILWIVTDDQRLDSIAAFNRMRSGRDESPLGEVSSPNVDRLAAMGTTFINTFNVNPSCAPSRVAMHAGRYSHHTAVYGFEYYNPTGMPHWKPLVPEVLRDVAGYQTISVGKIGIRALQFSKRPGDGRPRLYDTDLGYRNEFAAQGLVDWNAHKERAGSGKGSKVETFFFPDGRRLVWREDGKPGTDDREEIRRRTDLFRGYRPGGDRGDGTAEETAGGEIYGGVNPQSGDATRDAGFLRALLDHMEHADRPYTDMLGGRRAGPSSKRPIFIHCGFDFPHTPVLPPEEFRRRFRDKRYSVPAFTAEELAAFPPQLLTLFRSQQSAHFTDAEKQRMIADYYAYCAYGDTLVGRLVDAFIEYSVTQRRPWLVVYVCGDNGWRLNEHGMVSKFAPFDTDLRNPIIVASSDKERFPAGKVVEEFAQFVDIAPTFLAAAGIDITTPEYGHLDGYDLAKVASGELPPRDYIIAECRHVIGPRGLIRCKDFAFSMKIRDVKRSTQAMDWAVTADLADVEPMLFDLRSDPEQTVNLAFEPRYRQVVDLLREKLQNILLGDGRVEVEWTSAGGDTAHVGTFASGADDKRLVIPADALPPVSSR
jgi:arylsulfatase A-like enzyme